MPDEREAKTRTIQRYERALKLIADDLSDFAPEALQAALRVNIAHAALAGHYVFKDAHAVKYRIRRGPLRGTKEVLCWPRLSSTEAYRKHNQQYHASQDVRRMRKLAKEGGEQ